MARSLPIGPMYADFDRQQQPTTEASYQTKMLYWKEDFRREAIDTARLNEELPFVKTYMGAIMGRYWDRRRPKYKSSFYTNRINKARTDNLALLTDTRPQIDVYSRQKDRQDQADIVHKIFEHEWLTKDMDLSLVGVADIAKWMGTGFWKIGASAPGTMNVLPCGPDSVMPIQPGFGIQSATGVYYRTWKPPSYFHQKFPFEAVGIEKEAGSYDTRSETSKYNRPDYIDEYVWNGMAPALQRALSSVNPPPEADVTIFKSIELQEYYVDDQSLNESNKPVLMRHPYLPMNSYNWWYWVNPGQRLYPRKRLVVYGGRRLMYDGPSPYWHGLYPFACLRFNPVPWSFWGLSQYRDLLPINSAINDIVAGILDMIKRALNPTAVTKSGAIPPASWKEFFSDMPGGKVYMQGMANVNTDLRYMQAPEIPAYVFQLLQSVLIPEFDRMSNAMDVSNLAKKKQVPGGDTLDQMRDSLNTSLRLEERYLEAFLRDVGTQCLSHVFQFYNTQQRMQLLGGDGVTLQDFDFNPGSLIPDKDMPRENYWKMFGLQIAPGSLHGGSKDRSKSVAMNLFARHAISLKYLYKVLEIPDGERIIQEMQQESQMGLGAGGGKPPRPTSKKNPSG